DLYVWQLSHKLVMEIFWLAKKAKKTNLNYEIWRQILKSAFSVPANIAEGFSSHKGKTYASHLEISRGSAGETQYWLIVLKEIDDIKREKQEYLTNKYEEVIKMLSRMINTVNSKP
ncbi:MAG TPA: four helix bundle protein, partial [Patescibacteria group bacterium]